MPALPRSGLGGGRFNFGGGGDWFNVDPNSDQVFRVVDVAKEFIIRVVHRDVEVVDNEGNQRRRDVICRDQDENGMELCPGCRDGIGFNNGDLGVKFWANVIVRGEDGAPDRMAIFSKVGSRKSGGMILSRLLEIDGQLASRGQSLRDTDLIIRRKGSGLQTRYTIDRDGDIGDLTAADLRLIERKRFDLTRWTRIPTIEGFYRADGGYSRDDDDDQPERFAPRHDTAPAPTQLDLPAPRSGRASQR
jgi:hypothetical protein